MILGGLIDRFEKGEFESPETAAKRIEEGNRSLP
jgi:hypothetical protein